jgi:hypothetical protein
VCVRVRVRVCVRVCVHILTTMNCQKRTLKKETSVKIYEEYGHKN